MIDENREKELDRIVREPFSITNILKNWYADRYGKNADVKNLYAWARANNRIIIKFNPISQLRCRALVSGINYTAFEVEAAEGNRLKGFHVAIAYSVFQVAPEEAEVEPDALVFDKAFRFENDEVVEIT